MKINIIHADITTLKVDVIVNAANTSLMGGGGVDGAIHRAAGPELLKECVKIRKEKLPTGLICGQAIVTKGYNLPAKWIIHTVAPVYGNDDINRLERCYLNCLKLAEELNAKSIAFPALGCGAYRIPIKLSANIVKKVLEQTKTNMQEIILAFNKEEQLSVYQKIFTQKG